MASPSLLSTVAGPVSASFMFLTQSQNVVVDGASAGIVFVTPNFVQQFVARNDASRILSQVFQSLEFQGRKLHQLTLAARFHGRKARRHITEHKGAFGTLGLDLRHGISEEFQKL